MALSMLQQASKLFKLAMGKGESNTDKQFFEESLNSGFPVYPSQVYGEWDKVPAIAPTLADGESLGVVKKFIDLVLTQVPGVANSFYHENLKDCIPFNAGDGVSYNYTVKSNTGTNIPFGQGEWVVDPVAGQLTFYGTLPANMPPKITFFKYIGLKGIPNPILPTPTKYAIDYFGAPTVFYIDNYASIELYDSNNIRCYAEVKIEDVSGQTYKKVSISSNLLTYFGGYALICNANIVTP